MPLLRKDTFVPRKPDPGLKPDDEVFVCEATKEVFKDYEEFFQRTILCNSLVWCCSITGKPNLTYEEAIDSERSAKKRLGKLSKPLKQGLVWAAHHTQRGRFADMSDDVYVFASARYFIGEVVEAIVNDQWCDCKIVKVIPPSAEEIEKDLAEEKEKEEKGSPSKSKKPKKAFSPPEHLFKYELEEVEPDEGEVSQVHTIDAEDIRREKGTFTREKNSLILKNIVTLASDGNFCVKPSVLAKLAIEELKFTDIFAGPEPVFEVTKRVKSSVSQNAQFAAKKKVEGKSHQGTLDGWVKGEKSASANSSPATVQKKKTPEQLEEEIKKMKENSERFKETMKKRAEAARQKRLEDKLKEKERKKEERRLLNEVMSDWKKPRDDIECEDLKAMPKPKPVHCSIPNHLFGDFLSLLEFYSSFTELMEVKDSFPNGITFDMLESALKQVDTPGGALFEIISFTLNIIFDLQHQEDEEVKLDKLSMEYSVLDKNMLGKDENMARQIKSATKMARWSMKHQGGQSIHELHLDEYSLTEVLRLHLESSGAFRSEKCVLWTYQQRGGYRLHDDPGLQFRMDEPQILEALSSKTVYELATDEKIKILNCLMLQILSFTTPRDEIDEKFNEYHEAKSELRNHVMAENKRRREAEEAEKIRKREEREKGMKKEEEPKPEENVDEAAKKQKDEDVAKLTDRQREALTAQKEKEEKDRQKKEDLKKSEAQATERALIDRVAELQAQIGPLLLGRDRAYRRFWMLQSLPGIFVEHDDENVGVCLPSPTPYSPNAGPLDEAAALEKVKMILDAKENESEKSSSDKENDEGRVGEVSKTYSKKNLKQKVLAAKNGSVAVIKSETAEANGEESPAMVNDGGTANVEIKRENDCEASESVVDQKHHIEQLPWGACLADQEICPVHSTILPKTHWSYFSTAEELDELIESLNVRGIREHELREKLIHERERIVKSFKKLSVFASKLSFDDEDLAKVEKKEIKKGTDCIASIVDLTLRDQILEMEEKIFFGTLGSLKIRDRTAWQKAIQDGSYDKQCDGLMWGGRNSHETPFESRIASALASRDTTRPSTPEPENKRESTGSMSSKTNHKIRDLACAILQIAQMMDPKYLKAPLSEDEKDKKKRLKEEEKKKKERDAEEADGVVVDHHASTTNDLLTPMQEWENSLMESSSYAQLFIHLTTLESSIIWAKSVMNAKCRICRKKTDPEKMLLCDGCDRGHHMYCLKPKLKSVPQGDWYCSDCKPKERGLRSPKKKTTRRVFSTEDDDEDTYDSEDAPLKPKAAETETEDSDADEADKSDDEEMEVAEDSPPRRRKGRHDVELPKKKKKAAAKVEEVVVPKAKNTKKGGLSQLLGKRKCAAEASERIARVANQESSQNSGSEAPSGERTSGERTSGRLRGKVSLEPEPPTSASRASKSRSSDIGSSSQARSKRRRAVDDKLDAVFNPMVLEDLLNLMIRHKDGWPFDRPITKADAPDYHKIIDKPMDLGTIRSGINRMKYNCNQEILDDVRQVFVNCFTYNKPEAEEFQCAVRLEKFFLKETKKLGLVDDDEEPQSGNYMTGDNPPPAKKSRRTF